MAILSHRISDAIVKSQKNEFLSKILQKLGIFQALSIQFSPIFMIKCDVIDLPDCPRLLYTRVSAMIPHPDLLKRVMSPLRKNADWENCFNLLTTSNNMRGGKRKSRVNFKRPRNRSSEIRSFSHIASMFAISSLTFAKCQS